MEKWRFETKLFILQSTNKRLLYRVMHILHTKLLIVISNKYKLKFLSDKVTKEMEYIPYVGEKTL